MSGHGQHDADAGQGASHVEEHETSSDDFPADEPRSPGWLPLLGGALFLAGIFAFVAMGSDSKTAQELAAANPSAAPTGSAPAANPAPRPAPAVAAGAAVPGNPP